MRNPQIFFSNISENYYYEKLTETSLSRGSVCSESWGLGSGLCAQGRGQEGVPQVPQKVHLLRPGKNCWQTHLILRLTGKTGLLTQPSVNILQNDDIKIFCLSAWRREDRTADDPQTDRC